MFQTVALVGESGSGKSTVIALLQRFYNPDSGQITLDGIEIRELQLKWLRQQMGLVSQEPVLFNETIRANIAYGKGGDATEAEIIAAAEMANAHKFISGLQQVNNQEKNIGKDLIFLLSLCYRVFAKLPNKLCILLGKLFLLANVFDFTNYIPSYNRVMIL